MVCFGTFVTINNTTQPHGPALWYIKLENPPFIKHFKNARAFASNVIIRTTQCVVKML
jgi:hypothetical protein